MRLENTVQVSAPTAQAWDLLMDVPRVIPCMPGAQLVEVVDESTWKARIDIKMGPVSLSFDADVKRELADADQRRVTLSTVARERRGRGRAQASIESTLEEHDGGTRIAIATDLTLSGAVAQYGRGMIADVSAALVTQFADCLQAQLTASPEEASAALSAAAKPVAGLPLALAALRRAFARGLRRAFRRPSRDS